MRYNLLNFPAGVVPVTRASGDDSVRANPSDRIEKVAASVEQGSVGLPVGVQVVGRPFEEHKVLAAMMAIESAAIVGDSFPHTPVA